MNDIAVDTTSGGMEITEANFLAICKSIDTRSRNLAPDIQKAALFAARVAETSGNCNLMGDLWSVIAPANQRKSSTTFLRAKAFKAWVSDFTPIQLPTDDKGTTKLAKGERVWDLDGMAAVNFWEHTAEQTPVKFAIDYLSAPFAALNRLQSARDKGHLYNDDGTPMSTEEFTKVRQTLTDMCALAGGTEAIKTAKEEANDTRKSVTAVEPEPAHAAA